MVFFESMEIWDLDYLTVFMIETFLCEEFMDLCDFNSKLMVTVLYLLSSREFCRLLINCGRNFIILRFCGQTLW